MKKIFPRILSLFLVVSLVFSTGLFQMSVFADEPTEEEVVLNYDPDPKPGAMYRIRSASDEYMDVGGTKSYYDLANGNSVIATPLSTSTNQMWELIYYEGYYQIVSIGDPGKMLSAYWATYKDGQPINARNRSAGITNAQRFALVPMGDGSFRIDTTGFELTKDTCVDYDGSELVQRTIKDDGTDPSWFFEIVGGDMFEQPSDVYNHELATWAMKLSYAAYFPLPVGITGLVHKFVSSSDPIKKFLEDSDKFDFKEENIQLYNYEVNKLGISPLVSEVAHVIAHSKVEYKDGTSRPLVVVAVRGTLADLEWLGNLLSAFAVLDQLGGFPVAKRQVLENFNDYLKDTKVDGIALGELKPIILLTGHSRGGAIANMLAADLNDPARTDLDNADIYSYTFASPNVERKASNNKAYNNIFNICNRNDVVPLLPRSIIPLVSLATDVWNKHGKDIYITMGKVSADGIMGHRMSVYDNWMSDPAHKNYSENSMRSAESASSKTGLLPKILSFKCPVDITIYDKDGNISAQTTNDVVDNMTDGEAFAWVTENGEKSFFLPYGSEFSHAKVVARDNGAMHCGIATIDAAAEEPIHELKAFENITLEKGREYYIDLNEDIEISDVRLMVTEDGAIIGEVASDGVTTVPVKGITIEGEHQRILTVGEETLVTVEYNPTLPTNRTIIWDSSNESVATVDINGVVTAHSPGGAIITGTSQDGGHKAQCIITVEPATEVSILGDSSVILKFGQQHQFTADATINSVSRPFTWTSSNESVVMISSNGLATALSLGNAIITATTKDGKTASVVVNVENETAITIKGESTQILTQGTQHQLIADVVANSTSLPISWTSSDESVALVTASGIVSAQAIGNALITATTKDGYVAQVLITVEAPTGISITGDAVRMITIGQQQQLTANVTTNSTSLPITWSSNNDAVAPVTANGLVTAQSIGTAVITATTKDGFSAQVMITVEAKTTISIAGDPTRILTLGLSEQLTANATQNSTSLPISWSSSDETVATVNEYGIVTAKAIGSAMISATSNDGVTAQVMVNVEAKTTLTISGKPSGDLVVGKPHKLTADVPHNSTALPITWSSSNEAVATISDDGIITPKKAGSTIITVTTNDGYSEQFIITVVKEECAILRWLKTFFGWVITPFKWLWNAISWPFREIGKL